MKALLDTHAFAWAVTEPGLLSATARAVVEDPTVTLLVSTVTAWEMSTKHRIGRWPEVAPVVQNFDSLLHRLGASALPLTVDHGLAAGGMEWPHRDPFDRALAAQAMREGIPLVTKDRAFAGLPGLSTLW